MQIDDVVSKGEGMVIRRRSQLDRLEPIETQARQLLVDVEALGADPMLTDAVNAIQVVREKIADWIDAGKPGAA